MRGLFFYGPCEVRVENEGLKIVEASGAIIRATETRIANPICEHATVP